MDLVQIQKVLHKYDEAILDDGMSLAENNDAKTEIGKLAHCRWMCQHAIKHFTAPEDFAKLNRWLGFVQGVLWAFNFFTIAQMRTDNRSEQKGVD